MELWPFYGKLCKIIANFPPISLIVEHYHKSIFVSSFGLISLSSQLVDEYSERLEAALKGFANSVREISRFKHEVWILNILTKSESFFWDYLKNYIDLSYFLDCRFNWSINRISRKETFAANRFVCQGTISLCDSFCIQRAYFPWIRLDCSGNHWYSSTFFILVK